MEEERDPMHKGDKPAFREAQVVNSAQWRAQKGIGC